MLCRYTPHAASSWEAALPPTPLYISGVLQLTMTAGTHQAGGLLRLGTGLSAAKTTAMVSVSPLKKSKLS